MNGILILETPPMARLPVVNSGSSGLSVCYWKCTPCSSNRNPNNALNSCTKSALVYSMVYMWLRKCCISSLQCTWTCPTHAACTQGMKIPVKHASKCHYFFHIIFPKYIVAFLEMHLHGTLWTIIVVFSVVTSELLRYIQLQHHHATTDASNTFLANLSTFSDCKGSQPNTPPPWCYSE